MNILKIIFYVGVLFTSFFRINAQLRNLNLVSIDKDCGLKFEINSNKLMLNNMVEKVIIKLDTIFYTDFTDTFFIYFDDSLVLELNSVKINLKSIKPGKTIIGMNMYFENDYDYIKLKSNGVNYFSFSSRNNYFVIGKLDCSISKSLCFTININLKSGKLVKDYNYGYYYTTLLDTNIKLIINREIITYKSRSRKFTINNNSNIYLLKKEKLRQKRKINKFIQIIPFSLCFE